MYKSTTDISFSTIDNFDVMVNYVEESSNILTSTKNSHTHDKCEIYINITGDVAFEVEGLVYPVFNGSVIITRPNESHHCIYRTKSLHKHYCLWFDSDKNPDLFPIFYKRNLGEKNLFSLSDENFLLLIKNLENLRKNTSKISKLSSFFYIIELISNNSENITPYLSGLSEDVAVAMTYINENFRDKISIKKLAKSLSIDLSTFERHFKSAFKISPTNYIKTKRLKHALELIKKGISITEACFESGFSDLPKFIELFKSQFNLTPKQYQLKLKEKSTE